MDPFTHALAGSLVADLLPFTRRLGRKAQIVAVLAGMAPDLDMLPAFVKNFPPRSFHFFDVLDYNLLHLFHRAYTHSLFFTFVASLALALAAKWLCGGRGAWWQWAALLWGAFLSHIFLDLLNPWGVRMWLPFSQNMPAWNLMPLIDPIFTGLLAVAFIVNHALRTPYDETDALPNGEPEWRRKTAAALAFLGATPLLGLAVVVLLTVRVMLTFFGVFPRPMVL